MKIAIVLFVIVSSSFLSIAQELKKKYLVSYNGEIPSYLMNVGDQVVKIPKSNITIDFESMNKVSEKMDGLKREAIYTIDKEDKHSIFISMMYQGELAIIKYELLKKSKVLKRIGLYPQPTVSLQMWKNK